MAEIAHVTLLREAVAINTENFTKHKKTLGFEKNLNFFLNAETRDMHNKYCTLNGRVSEHESWFQTEHQKRK